MGDRDSQDGDKKVCKWLNTYCVEAPKIVRSRRSNVPRRTLPRIYFFSAAALAAASSAFFFFWNSEKALKSCGAQMQSRETKDPSGLKTYSLPTATYLVLRLHLERLRREPALAGATAVAVHELFRAPTVGEQIPEQGRRRRPDRDTGRAQEERRRCRAKEERKDNPEHVGVDCWQAMEGWSQGRTTRMENEGHEQLQGS